MKQKLLLLFITLTFSYSSHAQWSIGDVAFSAYGSESATNTPSGPEDAFTIVLLRNVSIGESLAFTENGWFAAGGFRANESTCELAFTNEYVEGTQIVISRVPFEARDQDGNIAGTLTGSGLNLATGGDQIFVYDPANMPTAGNESGFIAAFQMNGDWDADSTSATTSAKPSVFTDGVNSLSIAPEVDNARISSAKCSSFSDIATLRTMLNYNLNWETNGTTAYDQSTPVCDFVASLSIDDEQFLNNAIKLSPNPVEDYFSLNVIDGIAIDKVEIYDITGKNVLTVKNYNVSTPINMSKIGSGIYLTKIYSGDKTVIKRLIKK